jgi:glycosidase
LAFFEKDSVKELVDLEYGKEYREFYKSLCSFRHNNSALAAGENVAPMVFVEGASENVLAFTRANEENTVFCIFNFSAEPTTITFDESVAGEYDCVCGQKFNVMAGEQLELGAWEYKLLSK